jgi:hypothetical protein
MLDRLLHLFFGFRIQRRGGRYASFFRLQQRETGPVTLAPISATA